MPRDIERLWLPALTGSVEQLAFPKFGIERQSGIADGALDIPPGISGGWAVDYMELALEKELARGIYVGIAGTA